MLHLRTVFLITYLALSTLSVAAEDYDSLISQALVLRDEGDMAGAEQLLYQAYSQAENKSEAAYLLALVLAYQEKFTESENLLAASLADYPENFELRLTKARVQAYQGQFTQAGNTLNELLVQYPLNEEALVLAGRISLYKKQYLIGKEQFLQALASNPESLDALIGLYDSEVHFGNTNQAETYLLQAERIAPNNADVLSRKNHRIATTEPVNELIVTGEVSQFDYDTMRNWREQVIEYRHGRVSEGQQYLRFERANRFSLNDSYWEAGASIRNHLPIPLNISFGVGKDSIFLPEKRLQLGTEFDLNQGNSKFGATLGLLTYRHSRYESGAVQQIFWTMEHYLVNTNGWVVPGVSITDDESGKTNFGFQLAWHHQVTARIRYGLRYSDAPETENNITTDTRTYHAYFRYRLSDGIRARIDFARNLRQDSYTRDSFSLTLAYRF